MTNSDILRMDDKKCDEFVETLIGISVATERLAKHIKKLKMLRRFAEGDAMNEAKGYGAKGYGAVTDAVNGTANVVANVVRGQREWN